MTRCDGSRAIGLVLILASLARAQGDANPNQVAAKVERAPLFLMAPDRFRVPTVLEPLRKVAVMATGDGVLKTVAVTVGATVREGQELARLDPGGALARLKIAMAGVREMQAEFEIVKGLRTEAVAVAGARLDAAKARAEMAQMEVEACTLRAPFNGRVMAVTVSPGQYLAKGSTILEIDDVSSVRVLLPVDRTAVTVGGTVNFTIEGAGVAGRAQAVLPLPEAHATLRELATPLAAAWVTVANASGSLEPGQRAQSPYLPNAPIAGVASYSIHKDVDNNTVVQVIRGERVVDVTIRVLGILGPDRTQVSGPFRASDVLIQASSVPLRAGTFIRFNDAASRGVEGQPPPADQVGEMAEVAPGIAPIGSGGRPRAASRPPSPPVARPAAGGNVTPF